MFTVFLVVLFLGVKPLPGKKLLSLPEVIWPFEIFVDKGQVYISDSKALLHYYSLKDSRYVKQLCRKGEGPQELSAFPVLTLTPDCLFIYDLIGKAMYFSRNGDYLREFRTGLFKRLSAVGSNFLGIKVVAGQQKGNTAYEYSIYSYENKEMKYKKLIYYYEWPPQKRRGDKTDYEVIHDDIFHIVYDNKVFIADSKRGMFVDIFDSNGNDYRRIRLNQFEKVKVTEEFKNSFFGYVNSNASYATANSMYNYVFPEYYPAFYRFAVDKNKLYFLTYIKKDNKREVIIADWKGKFLKKAYVTWIQNSAFTNFSIRNNKFYYITENEDTEEWELHVEDIK